MSTAEKTDRPSILERLGVALNSSDLSPDDVRDKPVDLIGALAYVQINPGRDEHQAHELATVDPRTELGSVLLRIKIAGDNTLGERAVRLLMRWMREQKAYSRWRLRPGQDSMFERFARQALAEWLYPVCPICHGRQVLGMERGEVIEKRVRCRPCKGAGSVERAQKKITIQCTACRGFGWWAQRRVSTTKAKVCDACLGSGARRKGIDGDRMRALDVAPHVYEKHWVKRFAWLAAAFDRIDQLERNCLHAQFIERINPVQQASIPGSR